MGVFLFEIKYLLKNRITWVYFYALMVLAFLVVNVIGGVFDSVKIQVSGDQLKLNSPFVVSLLMSIFNMLGIVITANFIGNSLYRDHRYQSNQLVFSSGISKMGYLLPRFLAPFLVNGLIYLAVPIGILIASYMPYLDQEMFGPFIFEAYWVPLLTKVFPNTLFVGSIFFLLTILSKNNSTNWIAIIGFYVLYGVAQSLSGDIDNREIAALLEPFGMNASATVSTTMSAEEQNTQAVPLENLLLWNRIIWTCIGLVLLTLGYFLFSFSLKSTTIKRSKKASEGQKITVVPVLFKKLQLPVPVVSPVEKMKWYLIGVIAKLEILKILRSRYFKVILVLMLVLMGITATQIGKMYDTVTYPVTYNVAEVLLGVLNLLLFLFIMLFSGEMVWNARKFRVEGFEDAMPIASWQRLAGQLLGLNTVLIVILLVVWFIGVTIQTIMGFTAYKPLVYIGYLTGAYLKFSLLIAFSFFVQSLSTNRFIGYFILIVWYLLDSYAFQVVFQHNLLIPMGAPAIQYSDMNGFGGVFYGVIAFRVYWAFILLTLLYIAAVFYPRGTEIDFGTRFRSFKQMGMKTHVVKMSYGIVGTVLTGSFIFYNTNVLNQFQFSSTAEKIRVNYEKTHKHFAHIPQAKLTEVALNADLNPDENSLYLDGVYTLKNTTFTPLDTLVLHYNDENTILLTKLNLVKSDKESGFYVYTYPNSIQPNEEFKLEFEIKEQKRGFGNQFSPGVVRENGTLIWNSILPQLGYNEQYELKRNRIRKNHGLPHKPFEHHRNDDQAIQVNGVGSGADQIKFKATISTSSDQQAFTSGNLIREWEENGKKHYQYELNGEISNIFSFVSARYESYETMWYSPLGDTAHKPVNVSVHYHPAHRYNVELMTEAVKFSLDYYTTHFGPYQHDLVRILEFPRYATMAVSFPNTIPFSEGIGFIADITPEEGEIKIDYPFWVTAHEVAHQWWAHQLIPANTEGASFLTESLAQYSSVQVLKQHYGEEMTAKFLKNELHRYLISRSNKDEPERPLSIVSGDQQHIFYNKGAIVMYALSAYIGEANFNVFLKQYLDSVRFVGPPYPTSISFIDDLYEAIPDSMGYLVKDWIEHVTLYDFELEDVSYTRDEDLNYTATVELTALKYQFDEVNKEREIAMHDWVECVFRNSRGKELVRKFIRLKEGKQLIEFKLSGKPKEFELDPQYLLIRKDGIKALKKEVAKK